MAQHYAQRQDMSVMVTHQTGCQFFPLFGGSPKWLRFLKMASSSDFPSSPLAATPGCRRKGTPRAREHLRSNVAYAARLLPGQPEQQTEGFSKTAIILLSNSMMSHCCIADSLHLQTSCTPTAQLEYDQTRAQPQRRLVH